MNPETFEQYDVTKERNVTTRRCEPHGGNKPPMGLLPCEVQYYPDGHWFPVYVKIEKVPEHLRKF